MHSLERNLLNHYQRDFPLTSQPFAQIAKEVNSDTASILHTFKILKNAGKITRIGPVFRPNTIGVSTLAALKAPSSQLETIAEIINQYPEVNHNYEREHAYNLWFVATAPDAQHLENTLQQMEQQIGIDIMRLPLLKEYYIDLGFTMPLDDATKHANISKHHAHHHSVQYSIQHHDELQQRLLAEIQSGLPLVDKPYQAVADTIGTTEQEVLRRIDIMLTAGTIRRMGVVVRHRELGYRANAMLVWDIPDEQIDKIGTQLSQVDCITLCYQRPRHLPHWRYNLFTMIHGKDKPSVEACVQRIVSDYGLQDIPRATLFSKRRFKQRGACYSYAKSDIISKQSKVATYGNLAR